MKILNLHSHSEFSNMSCGFKDTTNKLKDLLDYAYDNDHAGIALTDHESVTGHIQAEDWLNNKIKNAETDEEKKRAQEFNLILGNEIYIAREGLTQETHETGERFSHFILLALDKEGQAQLRELSSRAWRRGYMKNVMRRFNYMSDLEEIIGGNPGHIVGTTACIANPAGNVFLNHPTDVAGPAIDDFMNRLLNIFGAGNIFVELAPALYTEQIEYNKFMVNRYKDNFPFVITNDVHYLTKNEWDTFSVFMKGAKREVDQFYKYSHFMTEKEIRSNMNYLDEDFITQSMQNALDIGNRSERYSLKSKIIIPVAPIEDFNLPQEIIDYAKNFEYMKKYLESEFKQDRKLAEAVITGYLEKEEDTPERREKVFSRLNNEWEEVWGISEAVEQRVSDYMLTMKWIIGEIWESGTLVGPGRGSAVAFVTNYYLNITDVNPIDYGLEIPYWRLTHDLRASSLKNFVNPSQGCGLLPANGGTL